MFHWIHDTFCNELHESPFSPEWETILASNVPHYRYLHTDEQRTMQRMIQQFVAEKTWEGCGGLELTDEIRVTIAAEACLLQLGLPHDCYRTVESLLIYPSTVVLPERHPGVFEQISGPVREQLPILGQAWRRGPVILVWDAVLHDARHPEQGHNVVYHEFAHKLDMLDGTADGTPPLAGREQMDQWITVCNREFIRLRALAAKGQKTFLDAYGTTNEAEFFAVATEEFFDRPLRLQQHAPDLYRVLGSYYGQDPAARVTHVP